MLNLHAMYTYITVATTQHNITLTLLQSNLNQTIHSERLHPGAIQPNPPRNVSIYKSTFASVPQRQPPTAIRNPASDALAPIA